MHHLTCGISSLLHSVNLILFIVLLVHLILRISPHNSHHLRSHHLSLPMPFTPDLKLSLSQILSSIVTLIPSGLTSRILTCTELKGHCFVCFSFWLVAMCTRLSCIISFRVHVKLFYRTVSYRIVTLHNVQSRRIRKLGPGSTIRVEPLSTHCRETLC